VHQQAPPRSEQLQQRGDLLRFRRRRHHLLVRQEGEAARQMPRGAIPKLNDGPVRALPSPPATPDDLPFVVAADFYSHQRYLIAALRDERLWRLDRRV